MFSDQTETELRRNLQWEAGMQGLVTLPADAYRELVLAARKWDAAQRSTGHVVDFRPDGSVILSNGQRVWPGDGTTWSITTVPLDTLLPPPAPRPGD
jgi:hypothetical protein